MPVAESAPSVGFSPTMLLSAAGTRPEPAVSVPSAKAAMPCATATAEPEEEPPGTIVRIERIARNRIGRAYADQARRELVEIGLAEADRAGFLELRHHEGVGLSGIGEVRAGSRGRHAGDVDIVLDREGNAPERTAVGLAKRAWLPPAPAHAPRG